MNLVDVPHEFEIEGSLALGLVVECAAADTQQFALTSNAEVMVAGINRLTLLFYSPKALAFFWSHSTSTVN